jgi:hypothetical protein
VVEIRFCVLFIVVLFIIFGCISHKSLGRIGGSLNLREQHFEGLVVVVVVVLAGPVDGLNCEWKMRSLLLTSVDVYF